MPWMRNKMACSPCPCQAPLPHPTLLHSDIWNYVETGRVPGFFCTCEEPVGEVKSRGMKGEFRLLAGLNFPLNRTSQFPLPKAAIAT